MDDVAGLVSRLINFENTVLHDQWKATGGITSLGAVVTPAEAEARHVYVHVANFFLDRASQAFAEKAKAPLADWATLERLYKKILERRDRLLGMGYGSATPQEGKIVQVAAELTKSIASAIPAFTIGVGAGGLVAILVVLYILLRR